MTSLFFFLILPSFNNKPSHLSKEEEEKNGNLIIPFNQEDESRTKEWRLLYSSGGAALSTAAAANERGKENMYNFLNLEREPLSLRHRRLCGRDQQSQFKRPAAEFSLSLSLTLERRLSVVVSLWKICFFFSRSLF
jgi:hypothetical protein